MEGSSSKRPLENPEENSNPSKKVRKAYTLEFKRNFTENDEDDIDELYRNEIVIDNN